MIDELRQKFTLYDKLDKTSGNKHLHLLITDPWHQTYLASPSPSSLLRAAADLQTTLRFIVPKEPVVKCQLFHHRTRQE